MRFLPSSLLALISVTLTSAQESPSSCGTISQPNPIASQYFANITGTLNGTLAILPIPLSLARRIIPSKYEILTEQYEDLLPYLPKDTYPALLQAVFDHDIRYMEYSMPDFSRASIEFPFIGYFSDSDAPFRYVPDMFMTSTNEMGINASREYGGEVYPSTFSPSCDAYAHAEPGTTEYSAQAENAFLKTVWKETNKSALPTRFPMAFFKNTVNQPIFGDKGMCNHQTRMFNTPLSAGEFAPRQVSGTVQIKMPDFFDSEMEWTDAVGLQIDTPFIEKHMIDCEDVRGWKFEDDEITLEEQDDALLPSLAAVANSSMVGLTPVMSLGAMMRSLIMSPAMGMSG